MRNKAVSFFEISKKESRLDHLDILEIKEY